MNKELVKLLEGCVVEVRCEPGNKVCYYGLLAKANERGVFLNPGVSRGMIGSGDENFRQRLAEALRGRPMVFINWKLLGDVSGSDYTAEQLSIKRKTEVNLTAPSVY